LKSVASATVAPASSSARPGAHRGRPRKKSVAGSSVATVDDPASAAMPASLMSPKWSADAAPSSAASSAPSTQTIVAYSNKVAHLVVPWHRNEP
jgi:hypothetical protein